MSGPNFVPPGGMPNPQEMNFEEANKLRDFVNKKVASKNNKNTAMMAGDNTPPQQPQPTSFGPQMPADVSNNNFPNNPNIELPKTEGINPLLEAQKLYKSPEELENSVNPKIDEEKSNRGTKKFNIAQDGAIESPNSQQFFQDRTPTTFSNNPLEQFYRTPIYTKIPSMGNFNPGEINFTNNGEIAVYPMTTSDELIFKSPDALLNGDAVETVLKSCVPGVKNIRKLTSPDVDVILLAIRSATYGDQMDLGSKCPKCEHENEFGVSIENVLTNMRFLNNVNSVKIDNGLTVYIKPYTFDETTKAALVAFEEARVVQETGSDPNIPDIEKIKIFNESTKRITDLNINLYSKTILKVVLPDSQEVNNHEHITKWLKNISAHTFSIIEEKVKELNTSGFERNVELTCGNCSHVYTTEIAFDPSRFFA